MKVQHIFESRVDEIVDLSKYQQANDNEEYNQDYISELINMFDAAKRGLGIINRLRNPEDKKKHLRNVFINLNKIRATLEKAYKVL